MLKVTNVKIPANADKGSFGKYIAAHLRIPESELLSYEITRLSVDSRKKSDVHFVLSAAVKLRNERAAAKRAEPYEKRKPYVFPYTGLSAPVRPVVVGAGPAGLFAALCLSQAGIPPILLERGKCVEERTADVERFWNTGELDESSNVQFGEGGAGTFSDGKLTTGINDERIPFVLQSLVDFGAPKDIVYSAKPHIGTDVLRKVVRSIREKLISLGCDIRFSSEMTDVNIANGQLTGITVKSGNETYSLPCTDLILAPGNSARNTFRMLCGANVPMEAKSFAVGVRIEHLQKDVDLAQYGQAATLGTLPASDYKLAVHLPSGRGVFTFCVCPGGRVVAAASEKGGVVTNGMSDRARDGININGGLLVGVSPDDFDGLFGGVEFQEKLERAAFMHGGSDYRAPAQLVGDFLEKRPSSGAGTVIPTYMPGVNWCSLWNVLPEFVCTSIAEALPLMENRIRGFSAKDAVLTAVETRSSSPVRILRGQELESEISGIFPCGEGAGYAGGITSASVDGIKSAEALCRKLAKSE